MPTTEETLPNISIRYKQSIRYIMARSGADLYKLLLVIAWLTVEIVCVRFGFKASGYTLMQLQLYDIYHTMLIEMGESQGFGEGWAPWIRILIISSVSAVAFILLSTVIGNGGGQSQMITRLIAQFITGNISNVTTDNNEHGVPQPSDGLNSLAGALGGINLSSLGNLGNLDLSSLLATLGTAVTSNMQQRSTNNPPESTGPRRRSSRRGPTWRS